MIYSILLISVGLYGLIMRIVAPKAPLKYGAIVAIITFLLALACLATGFDLSDDPGPSWLRWFCVAMLGVGASWLAWAACLKHPSQQ